MSHTLPFEILTPLVPDKDISDLLCSFSDRRNHFDFFFIYLFFFFWGGGGENGCWGKEFALNACKSKTSKVYYRIMDGFQKIDTRIIGLWHEISNNLTF